MEPEDEQGPALGEGRPHTTVDNGLTGERLKPPCRRHPRNGKFKKAVRKDRNFFLTNVALGYWIVRRVEVRQGKESIVFTGQKMGVEVARSSHLLDGRTGYSRWSLALWQCHVRCLPRSFEDEHPLFPILSFI